MKESVKLSVKEPVKKSVKKQLPPDTLFWNIFIAVYGETEFFQIGSKYTNREWEEKTKIRASFMTNSKELQTTNQKVTLGNIKEMMSEYMTSTTTSLLGVVGISVYYKISIILVDQEKKTTLSFLPQNTELNPCILLKINGKGKSRDHYEVADESVLKDTFGLASYTRPLRAISTYKRAELIGIAEQCQLSLCDKSKDELYRILSEHLVWK